MATTEIKEKEVEKEYFVYPVDELINSIKRMLQEKIPVKIALVSQESGDVVFTTTLNDLGITRQVFHSHPFFISHVFTNFIGELLVRGNMEMFCDRVMNKNYDVLVKKYNHRDFGLRINGNDILFFQFNISFIYKIMNELISREISDEVSKIILSGAKKIKRDEEKPSITSFVNDGNNLRLIVSNHSSVCHLFENAIKTILNFYNIKNKEIFITQNIFNWQIEITDAKNEKSHETCQ